MFKLKYFQNSNLFFWTALIIAYVIAIINGARLPTLWSINYYLPGFFDGFYRRSLAGTFLNILGDYQYNYWIIAGVQLLFFSTFNYIIINYIKNKDVLKWLFILFLIGPAGGFMFHIVGYIDFVLYLTLLIAISCKRKYLGNAIMIASILFHEMAILTTFPLFMAFKIHQKEHLKSIISFALLSILSFCVLLIFSKNIHAESIQFFLAKLHSKANFNIRDDYYELFGVTYFKIWYTKEYLFQILLLSPLYIVAYLLQYKNHLPPYNRVVTIVISGMACISPLLLGLTGYDINRWVFLTICNSFFIFSLHYKDLYQYKKILYAVMILYISIGHLYYFDKKQPRLQNIDNIDLFWPDLKESIFKKPEKY